MPENKLIWHFPRERARSQSRCEGRCLISDTRSAPTPASCSVTGCMWAAASCLWTIVCGSRGQRFVYEGFKISLLSFKIIKNLTHQVQFNLKLFKKCCTTMTVPTSRLPVSTVLILIIKHGGGGFMVWAPHELLCRPKDCGVQSETS